MTPSDLEAMVAMMRKLGVIECDGIVLGPPVASGASSPELTEAEKHANRIAQARQDIRDRLGAVGGYDMPDVVIDRYLPPDLQ